MDLCVARDVQQKCSSRSSSSGTAVGYQQCKVNATQHFFSAVKKRQAQQQQKRAGEMVPFRHQFEIQSFNIFFPFFQHSKFNRVPRSLNPSGTTNIHVVTKPKYRQSSYTLPGTPHTGEQSRGAQSTQGAQTIYTSTPSRAIAVLLPARGSDLHTTAFSRPVRMTSGHQHGP